MHNRLSNFFLFILIVIPNISFPQESTDFLKIPAFGEISSSELVKKNYKEFPDAEAIILFDHGIMDLTLEEGYTLTRHLRIHILSEEGLSAADQIINYYNKDNFESIGNILAQTYTFENGQLKHYKISDKLIFREENEDGLNSVRLSFPKIKVGSIIEYSYILTSKPTSAPRTWSFQSKFPILLSKLNFTDSFLGHYDFQILSSLVYQVNFKEFFIKNVPAILEQPFAPSLKDYIPNASFFPNPLGFYTGFGLKDPQAWTKLAKAIFSTYKLNKFIEKTNFLKNNSEDLTAHLDNQEEKIEAIYNHILTTIGWNGRQRSLPVEKPEKVYKQRKGSSSEINCTLIAMLQAINIKAEPVLISTKDHGMINREYARISSFNHLICRVMQDGKPLFLDATNPQRPYKLLARQDLNYEGWLLNKKESRWISIFNHYQYGTQSKVT